MLQALPASTLRRLIVDLKPVALARGQAIDRTDEPIRRLHFVNSGFVSSVRTMRDGRSAEVGGIGIEGASGVNTVFSARGPINAVVDAVVQIPGIAFRLDRDLALRQMAEDSALRAVLVDYARFAFGQMAQHAACNRLHTIARRCCTWLLIAADSVPEDAFPLTHESLAQMLGGTRAGVTLALRALKADGLLAYGPGQMRIVDRLAIEARACECYATREAAIAALFPLARK